MRVEDHVTGMQDVVQSSSQSSTRGKYLSGKAVEWRGRFPTVFQTSCQTEKKGDV